MDLVVVEVLQAQAVACQQPRHRVDRRHQQALLAIDEVHRRRLAVLEIGQDRQAARLRPLLAGQQYHRGAVGQRRRVGRREGAARTALEHRLEGADLLQVDIRAQVLVAGQAAERRHQVVLPALLIGRGQLVVALEGQPVLLVAGDLPGLRHQFAGLPHRQPGARLAVARDGRDHVARADLQQALELVQVALAAVGLEENLAQALVDPDRRVGSGIDAAGDAAVDLPEGDLVGHQDRRLQAGTAGLLDIVGRGFRGQARTEHAFAGQVEVARMLQHGAGHHLAKALSVQVVALHQAFQGGSEHLLVARRGVHGVRAGEGNTVAADNGDPAQLGHGRTPCWNRLRRAEARPVN